MKTMLKMGGKVMSKKWALIVFAIYRFSTVCCFAGDFEEWKQLDRRDFNDQMKGYEWLINEDAVASSSVYPIEMTYFKYESHPQIVMRDGNLYDENGQLFRVSFLLRGAIPSQVFKASNKASKFGDADWVENRTKRIENFLIQQQESVIKHQKDYYDSCHYVAMATLENIILPENYFFAKEVILSNNQTLSKYSYKDQELLLEKLKRQYGYDKEFFIDDNQIFFIFKLGFDYSSKRYNRLSEEETRVKNDRVKDAFGKSYYSSAFRGKNVDVLESESNLYVVKKKKSLLGSFYSVSLSDEDVEKIRSVFDFDNQVSSSIFFDYTISDKDKKGKNKIVTIKYTIKPSHAIETTNNMSMFDLVFDEYDLKMPFEKIDHHFSCNDVRTDCSSTLLYQLMANDYRDNKYNISRENFEVQKVVEQILKLRRIELDVSASTKDAIALETTSMICQLLGVAYRKGITKEQILKEYHAKNPNVPYVELKNRYNLIQEGARKIAIDNVLGLKYYYSSAFGKRKFTKSNSASRIAENYVNQLVKDHYDEVSSILEISRVNDMTFDVKFAGDHIIRVKYFTTKPYNCSYHLEILK